MGRTIPSVSFRLEPTELSGVETTHLESQIALCESHAQTGLRGGSDDLTPTVMDAALSAAGIRSTSDLASAEAQQVGAVYTTIAPADASHLVVGFSHSTGASGGTPAGLRPFRFKCCEQTS